MFKSFNKFIFQKIYWLTIKEFSISEKLELVVSYTEVQFVVELRTNTHAFPVQVRVVPRISCSLCLLVPKGPARTCRWLKSVTAY
jgi:hypothetical protein